MKKSSSIHAHTEQRVAVVTSTYARFQDDHQVPWMREMASRTVGSLDSLKIYAAGCHGIKSHSIDGISVRRIRYAPAQLECLTHDAGAPSKVRSIWFQLLTIPYLLSGVLSVLKWCIQDGTRVLHIHWPFPHGLWALLPKWLLGVRVVSMCHGAELALARNNSLIRHLLTFFLKQSDEVCANSSHTKAEVKRLCGVEARVVPYGATVSDQAEAKQEKNEKPLLLFCGRLIQRKGIDVLLKAMPEILRQRDVDLVITGEGDRKAEWQELAQELGLEKSVRFAGFVSNEELGRLYQKCDLYVHPAIYDDKGDTEGLGVVLIEALANRKPVVASRVGGIVDVIIDNETGLLVPEKDPKALSEAVLRVLNNPSLATELGSRGHRHAKTLFDWDRCARLTLNVYQGEPEVITNVIPQTF